MADHHDYLALDWVRGEIQETLNQAQQTLESYVENPADSSRMRFCQTYLHQVQGTLKMVEFYGAALLAEEMEKLAEAVLGKRVANESDAQETLMRAILQLPPYLDRVQAGRHDLPVVLLPLLNDLRAVRGETLLSETALFKPDLSSLAKRQGAAVEAPADFLPLAKKLRQMYQIALLGLLRNQDSGQQLAYMARVFSRLEQISGGTAMSPLWSIVAALVEGLREQGIELSVSVKMMLGQVDRVLRQLSQSGAAHLQDAPPNELLKNLLFYVAKSTHLSPRVREVRERFRLDEALPSEELINEERARLHGPDQAAMNSVVQALSEELAKVKAALERHVQEGAQDATKLGEQITNLKQVGDTLAVLGLGRPRELVEEQLQALRAMVEGKATFDDERLMDVAGSLLYVESTLSGMANANRHRLADNQVPDHIVVAREAVLRECHIGLEDAKDGIVEFIASHWDKQHLALVPERLNAVRGGLELVQLERPAAILRQCVSFIEEKLLPEAVAKPEWRNMDTLADAITSVEYYLERLADDPGTRDDILKIARTSVGALGYPLADEPSEVEPTPEEEAPAFTGYDVDALTREAARQPVEHISLDSPALVQSAEHPLPVHPVEDGDAHATSDEVINYATPTHTPVSTPSPSDPGDDLIDDEIIEIFIEEAGEVLEALNQYFPRWAANTSDKEALTEFRRAFHTLKGSGRMVGARVVGELAWSVENMMNRVIDNTIKPSQSLIELVRKVHGVLPQLVEDFAKRRPPSVDVQPLMEAANTLAEGGQIGGGSDMANVANNDVESDEDIILGVVDEEAPSSEGGAEPDGSETLLEIFISEARNNLDGLAHWLDSLDKDFDEHPLDDLVHRCLHTMKGSARMAGVEAIAELAEPAEKCIKEMINMSLPADRGMLALLERTRVVFARALDDLEKVGGNFPAHLVDAEELIAEFRARRENLGSDGGKSIDRHLLNVFLSEGMDIILDAEGLLERWAQNPEHTEELRTLSTELRLLAGSSETAGLKEVHEMATRLAGCYERLWTGKRQVSGEFLTLARAGQEALINMMDCLAAGQIMHAGTDILLRLDDWLAMPDDKEGETAAGVTEEAIHFALPVTEHVAVAEPAPVAAVEHEQEPAVGELLQDEELGSIFLEEADDILAQSQDTLEAWHAEGGLDKVAELQRHLHTLKGGARMAGITHIGNLAHELEFLYEELALGQRDAAPGLYELLLTCHDRLASMVDQLKQGEPVFAARDLLNAIEAARRGEAPAETRQDDVLSGSHDLSIEGAAPHSSVDEFFTVDSLPAEESFTAPEITDAAQEISSAPSPVVPATSPSERDPELVAIFLEEAEEILEAAGQSLESWLEAPDNLVEVQSLQRDLHTLKGGARMAEVPELGNLSHELENLYEGLALGRLEPAATLFELLRRCHDRLAEMVEAVKANQPLTEASDLISLIRAYVASPEEFELPRQAAPTKVEKVAPAVTAETNTQTKPATANAATTEIVLSSDIDRDILGVFLEEATELSQNLEASLKHWQEEPDNSQHADELRRVLHTLKGGARLAGLVQLGDVSHAAESIVEEVNSADAALLARLQDYADQINGQLDQVRALASTLPAGDTQQQATDVAAVATTEVATTSVAPLQQARQRAARQAQQQPQEMVRIGADVLESLVNLAGETSINRGRVEQGVGEFASHINEMGNTVERLYEQLRRLDIETEAQIMSNYKQGVEAGHYGEDFDPLEMDQYSELHQITKQLSESASDLLDLKNSLIDQTRDTETLLLQQSRINTELQEKLMRTRMVPFSRLVPRLRRIVRQVSGELHKQVDFNVINPEGELDRSLMERIVAPLEHMLRNAVDHGVESPDKRVAAGKATTGNINLELGRDGGDVLLVLSDDGGGINTDAVRKKALERGLISADSQLTDQELQQFIFAAGFSTAEKVTQISGRGVGMDVVASDIKQMGGSVTIESTHGKGTRFIVRLPFTLAMNRALLVRVGEDAYAIPLTQVEGIVRISPYELEAFLNGDAEDYAYAGQSYDLDYLGQYVHDVARPSLEGVTTPLPVMLLRSQEHQVALVVDGLIGSREIVVKSVGPQLSTVAGISGATILGDGSVVIILDIHALIRAAHLQRQAIAAGKLVPLPQTVAPESIDDVKSGLPLIMVTDDSVTVRKVTTRLLERHGFEVMTAKDGVDAVAKLEEKRPDLMLLDIEMPRMDGFEVASHMRHDARFINVPIIMITSRTGDKHRERAFDIGVNSYLGKPFQEMELLETIRELLAVKK